MSKEIVVNHAKVTDMLQKMLQQGNYIIVDINKQVHWKTNPNDPIWVTCKEDKTKRKLYIYDTDIKDPEAIILNPLAETMVAGPEKLIFYLSLTDIVRHWIIKAIQLIVNEAAAHKEDSSTITDTKFIPILTPFIGKVDLKMTEELERIIAAGNKDFLNIYYNRSKKTSTLLFGIEEEDGDYIKAFPASKVRKKTWGVLLDIIKFILNVPADKKIKDVYTYTTEKVECPYFLTYANVWIKIWECLDPYLDFYDDYDSSPETIESLKEHISNAPVYRECTMWLKQPTMNVLSMPGTAKLAGHTGIPTSVPSWKTTGNGMEHGASGIIQLGPKPAPTSPSWMTNSYQSRGFAPNSNIITITRRGW